MGFISFNESYYLNKLMYFEKKQLTIADIYEIKQLLKVLDDLESEGYTNLNNSMERDFNCLTRLRKLLMNENEVPFETIKEDKNIKYNLEEYELSNLLDLLIEEAKDINHYSSNLFLDNVYDFTKWIGYENDTAYIFLLRDTLLPYVYFKNKYKSKVYPFLISRKFLEDITGIFNIDDEIRLPLYESLEKGFVNFSDYNDYCAERIKDILDKYPNLKRVLISLLKPIKEKKIVVIESGYMGTIPLMLKALDKRINFKLYSTAPFLYETYRNQIFSKRYEDIRKFETIHSHSKLLKYSSFKNNCFYVNINSDENEKNISLKEIKRFINN